MRSAFLAVTALCLVSCSPAPETKSEPPRKAEAPKPADESRRMPLANQVETKVIDKELMGKAFMPGGTLGHYKKGKAEWDLFLARLPSATDAAVTLPDWRKVLTGSKLIPSFGGYYGTDNGRRVFVFSKGPWIAGVAGLEEKDADAVARVFAAQIPAN